MTTTEPGLATGWDVLLRDGRIAHLRPVTALDEEQLHRLNERVSARTRLMRYFSVSTQPAVWYVDHLMQQAHLGNALVACVNGEVVGVASYARLEADPCTAELGLLVDDPHQDSGLGSLLLEHLAHLARHHGVRAFHADVLAENGQMLRMLRSSGLTVTATTGAGIVELVLDLTEDEASRQAEQDREITAERASLQRVLAPSSCAVVGSSREGTVGAHVMRSLRSYGYKGTIHQVDERHGLKALSGQVDLVVVAVPAPAVLEVAQEAADIGAAGLLVLTAGFAESGPEGQERQDELLGICRSAGIRLIGPNCLGILNSDPDLRLNATFVEAAPRQGRVALVSQSGAVGVVALREAERRRTGLSLVVSTGNKADVSGNDLLEYLAADERTAVIGLYLESFGNPRKFARIAASVGRTKPVVVVKAGRSAPGAEAGRSHTAAAATPDVATDALLHAAGAIRAEDMEELLDVVGLLDSSPLPRGTAIAVIGNSGGPGVLAIDALVAAGLKVAELAPETQEELRRLVPASASVQNPVDLLSTVTETEMHDAVVALMDDPAVGAVLTVYTPLEAAAAERFAAALVRAANTHPDVPLITTFPGVAAPPLGLDRVDQPPLPFFAYPEQAARALAKTVVYASWRTRPPAIAEPRAEAAPLRTPERAVAVSVDGPESRWLEPSVVDDLLRATGIKVVPAVTVHDAAGAVRVAEEFGYPVVLKAHGPDLVHKADVGAVMLGLREGREVAAAWFELVSRLGSRMTGGLVQKQLPTSDGLELLAGAYVDAEVGPLVLAGMGGTLTDVLDDRVLRVPPVTREQARTQLEQLRCAPALHGFRGRPPLAADAAADVLVALGRLLHAFPEISEVDLNPLLVTPQGVCVLDARIAVAASAAPPVPPFRALRPPRASAGATR